MIRLLLIEDDRNLGSTLARYLEGEGFGVTLVTTLTEARKHLKVRPAALLLDWNLPDGQGIDFLREVRSHDLTTPIILLTARTELIDKVLGLESGANDYLTKPVEPRELLARVRAHLRRSGRSENESTVIRRGTLSMDTARREVRVENNLVELRKLEFDLLKLLLENPDRVFTREELLNKVWGYDSFPSTRTVDTHVLQLRQKLGDSFIETMRGIGYRLKQWKESV